MLDAHSNFNMRIPETPARDYMYFYLYYIYVYEYVHEHAQSPVFQTVCRPLESAVDTREARL